MDVRYHNYTFISESVLRDVETDGVLEVLTVLTIIAGSPGCADLITATTSGILNLSLSTDTLVVLFGKDTVTSCAFDKSSILNVSMTSKLSIFIYKDIMLAQQ